MTVHVDDARLPHRGMLMCHMIAGSTAELAAMARSIGVFYASLRSLRLRLRSDPAHIEGRGTWKEHLNVCQTKRSLAIAAGAVAVTRREMARLRRHRKDGPDTA